MVCVYVGNLLAENRQELTSKLAYPEFHSESIRGIFGEHSLPAVSPWRITVGDEVLLTENHWARSDVTASRLIQKEKQTRPKSAGISKSVYLYLPI